MTLLAGLPKGVCRSSSLNLLIPGLGLPSTLRIKILLIKISFIICLAGGEYGPLGRLQPLRQGVKKLRPSFRRGHRRWENVRISSSLNVNKYNKYVIIFDLVYINLRRTHSVSKIGIIFSAVIEIYPEVLFSSSGGNSLQCSFLMM